MLNRNISSYPIFSIERLTLRQIAMTDVVVIDYAFNTIQVQRIDAYVHKDNQSSIKLLEKLSFLNSNNIDEIHTNLISYHLSNTNVKY